MPNLLKFSAEGMQRVFFYALCTCHTAISGKSACPICFTGDGAAWREDMLQIRRLGSVLLLLSASAQTYINAPGVSL